MEDTYYAILIQLEQDMKNEISTASPSREKLQRTISAFKPEQISAQTALKTLDLELQIETEKAAPSRANIAACRLWHAAIENARKDADWRLLFARMDFESALNEQEPESKSRPRVLFDDHRRLRKWIAALLVLLTVLLFGVLTIALRWSYWACLIVLFLFMNLALWLCEVAWPAILRRRILRDSRQAAQGGLRIFLKHIALNRWTWSLPSLVRLFKAWSSTLLKKGKEESRLNRSVQKNHKKSS